MSDNTTLVLPVEVKALVVDEDNQDKLEVLGPDKYQDLPGNYYDATKKAYESNRGADGPFISDNILNRDCSTEQYETGVHLHWKLPSLLTEGKQNGGNGNVQFAQVPNRWLVTRIVANKNNAPIYTCWLIESDHIQKPVQTKGYDKMVPNAKSLGPTIPHIKRGQALNGVDFIYPDLNFHNQGKVTKQTGVTSEVVQHDQTDGSSSYLSELYATGSENFQELSFSGIYSKCRNVFGFHDELSDLPAGTTSFSYHVAGWYDNSPNPRDPISLGIITTDDVVRHYPNFNAETQISESWSTLCTGAVMQVQQSVSTPGADFLDVTIANNLSEAVSSFITKKTNDPTKSAAIENLLNAFQTGILSANTKGNFGPNLDEVLHSHSFSKHDGGIIYELKLNNGKKALTGSDLETLSEDLNTLNNYQLELEKNQNEIESMRYRIFADWYKWSIQRYNQYDLIPPKLLPPAHVISQGMTDANEFLQDEIQTGLKYLKGLTKGIKKNISKCKTKIAAYPEYTLEERKAPRYYAPNDPVLLFTGGDHISTHVDTRSKALARTLTEVVTTLSYTSGIPIVQGTLELPTMQSSIPASIAELLTEAVLFDTALDGFFSTTINSPAVAASDVEALQTSFLANSTYSGDLSFDGSTPGAYAIQVFKQPWNPVKMYWKCNYVPFDKDTAKATATDYSTDFVTGQFNLDSNRVGYNPSASAISSFDWTDTADEYSNYSLLNISVLNNLGSQLQKFIDGHSSATEISLLNEIEHTLSTLNTQLKSQQLSGFNQALLQKKQQLQMMVGDPNPLPNDANKFLLQISNNWAHDAVQDQNTAAPRPANVFNPIRGGYMQLTEIKLIDAHGQVRKYTQEGGTGVGTLTLKVASGLAAQGHDTFMYVPPAITQESRILMRWISAEGSTQESNSIPFTSPICGWVLPNFLDGSLNFYRADGTAIGMVFSSAESATDQKRQYISAPGLDASNDFDTDFTGVNAQLKNMATAIRAFDKAGFEALLASINTTLPTVVPSTFRQDKAAGILMGRPLALTLASFQLDLKGLPANDLGWTPWNTEIKNNNTKALTGPEFKERDSAKFTDVSFPVRLGNLNKINDGLVGYFVPEPLGGIDNMDYSHYFAYTNGDSPVINPDTGNVLNQADGSMTYQPIKLTANGPTQYAAMLVDPQAPIHATSGVLPVKSIDIPAYFYADALKKISVSFLMAPVLSTQRNVEKGVTVLPIPEEKQGKWVWNQISDGSWIPKTTVSGKVPTKLTLDFGHQTIEEGWLTWEPLDDPS
jgi:hypothetical protein